MSDTSPEARHRFLASLDEPEPREHRSFLQRLSAAEALVEECERADAEARVEMRIAQGEAPKFPDRRALSQAERDAFVAFQEAAEYARRTSDSKAAAQHELSSLLAEYDAIASESRLAMDGRLAGRRLYGPGED